MSQTNEKANKPAEKKTRARNPNGTFAVGNDFSDKYEDKYADELIKFFKKPIYKVDYRQKFGRNGEVIYKEPMTIVGDFPTFGEFAMKLGVSVTTLRAWAGFGFDGRYKHDRFAIAYRCCKEWAEGILRNGALTGKLDSNMAKFVLANDYNMTDKQQQDVKYEIVIPEDIAEESK